MAGRISMPMLFPHYITVIASYSVIDFIMRKLRRRGGATYRLIAWFGAVVVMICTFMVLIPVVQYIAQNMALARPYIAMDALEVVVLEPSNNRNTDFQSFPSMQVAFAAMIFASLWPVLDSNKRFLGSILLLIIAVSVVVTGVAFPADAVYAVLLAFILTFFVRWIVYAILLRIGIKC
jgi:hypothetical protein